MVISYYFVVKLSINQIFISKRGVIIIGTKNDTKIYEILDNFKF
jgi:hypothetical protein